MDDLNLNFNEHFDLDGPSILYYDDIKHLLDVEGSAELRDMVMRPDDPVHNPTPGSLARTAEPVNPAQKPLPLADMLLPSDPTPISLPTSPTLNRDEEQFDIRLPDIIESGPEVNVVKYESYPSENYDHIIEFIQSVLKRTREKQRELDEQLSALDESSEEAQEIVSKKVALNRITIQLYSTEVEVSYAIEQNMYIENAKQIIPDLQSFAFGVVLGLN